MPDLAEDLIKYRPYVSKQSQEENQSQESAVLNYAHASHKCDAL